MISPGRPSILAICSGRDGRQFVLPCGGGRTISTTEAAKRLSVSNHTILRMCENKELKAWRIRNLPKSPWRVAIESVDSYFDRKIARRATQLKTPMLASATRSTGVL